MTCSLDEPHPYGSRLDVGNKKSALLANVSQLSPASVTAGKDARSSGYRITELSVDSKHFKEKVYTERLLLVAFFGRYQATMSSSK